MEDKGNSVNIEKIFLRLSLIFGIAFSIIFPIFYEGDAQFHFDYSTFQTNVVVDRTSIGSFANFGYASELQMMQKGEYFNNYFVAKVHKIDRYKVHDQRAVKNRSFANDILHVVPAFGVWLGYHIYPSIGIMVLTARILASIFYSFCLYLIIKKVKYGKALFVLTALTPVMAIQGYSLSYDSLSFIISSGLIASQINFIFKKKVTKKDFFVLFFLSLCVALLTKMNMRLLLIITVFALLSKIFDLKKIDNFVRRHYVLALTSLFIVLFCGYFWFAGNHGGIRLFTMRMFNTFFTIESEQYTRGIFLGIFGDYTASYSLPWWCIYGYSIITFLLIFSESNFETSKFLGVVGMGIFFLNIFGTTAMFSTFNNSAHNSKDVAQVIGGQLGRYYTPLLPCLLYLNQIFPLHFNFTECEREKMVTYWATFSLSLLLVVTVYGFYYLKVPAFIQ